MTRREDFIGNNIELNDETRLRSYGLPKIRYSQDFFNFLVPFMFFVRFMVEIPSGLEGWIFKNHEDHEGHEDFFYAEKS